MIHFKDYKKAGFTIIGIHPILEPVSDEHSDGICGCGNEECKGAGKHPSIEKWQHPINWSDEQLEFMREVGNLTAFGIHCDGYLIIDIDPRNGGNDGYDALCNALDMEVEDEAGFSVNTGGGGKHIYFKLREGEKLVSHDKRFVGIDFKVSGFVIGCGSIHKSGNFYEVAHGTPSDVDYAPGALIKLLTREETEGRKFGGIEYTDDQLESMVMHIPNTQPDYDLWIRVGMAIHEETNGSGFELWDKWSSQVAEYVYDTAVYKWGSFGNYNGRTVSGGTLFMLASEYGYVRPVTFELTDEERESLEEVSAEMDNRSDGRCPLDYSKVNIYSPPGLCGRIADWVNSNCYFPAKSMVALSAIHTLGVIMGKNYVVDFGTGIKKTNLISIGLAASSVGKQTPIELTQQLIIAAGLAETKTGNFKSAKAIEMSLLRSPMLNGVVDEVGIVLGKMIGKNKGEHQTETAAKIMAAYSANSLFSCDKDYIAEEQRRLEAEMSKKISMAHNNEGGYSVDDVSEIEREYIEAIDEIQGGVQNPFFSFIGLSTETEFRQHLTLQNIQSGFIGRSIIFQDYEENPRPVKQFKPNKDIPPYIMNNIITIVTGGEFGKKGFVHKVKLNDRPITLRPDEETLMAAIKIQDWLLDTADKYKDSGRPFVPILRRCFEKIITIAGIVSFDGQDNIIRIEHLRYALAVVMNSTADLIRRSESIMLELSKDNSDRYEGLKSIVKERVIAGDSRTAIKRFVSRETSYKQADADRMIQELLKDGIIEETKGKRGGVAYRLTDEEGGELC